MFSYLSGGQNLTNWVLSPKKRSDLKGLGTSKKPFVSNAKKTSDNKRQQKQHNFPHKSKK